MRVCTHTNIIGNLPNDEEVWTFSGNYAIYLAVNFERRNEEFRSSRLLRSVCGKWSAHEKYK